MFSDLRPDEISYEDVLIRLKKLDENKAFGTDKIHPALIKNCATAFAFPLTLIFRASLASSELPTQFRSANVTPLFKKGDKTVPSNYRPVSLTSVPCKILEGIILDRVIDYIFTKITYYQINNMVLSNKGRVQQIFWKHLILLHLQLKMIFL